jgi:hypothetical protein
VPPHFVWADDARVHAFMRHSDPQNFGHLMVDDFLSAYTAGVARSMHAKRAPSPPTPHQLERFFPTSRSTTCASFWWSGARAAAPTSASARIRNTARAIRHTEAGCRG